MGKTNASEQISAHIQKVGGWRGEMLAALRKVILDAVPGLIEEWKWNTPLWSNQGGNVLAAGAFADHVKVNFFKGASLKDPKGVFNAGLDAKASRAIDIRVGDVLNVDAVKDLVRAAAALNVGKPESSEKKAKKKKA